ncbi:hypothetical protein [Nonomuraea sp. NPDC049784]|uniref:hypothetical protein n=1 Tax=Nonomuraea sp. NPDC049784 TaxID=3154361 RepID=UPI0033C27910
MSDRSAAGMPDAGEGQPEGPGFESEPGYVEARRDPCGPFVVVRWWQSRMMVRLGAWVSFAKKVKAGSYTPEKLPDQPGWVRFEIDEGFNAGNAPSGWRPKVFQIPEVVWDRFVDAVGRYALWDVGLYWMGAPPTLPPRASDAQRLSAVEGRSGAA